MAADAAMTFVVMAAPTSWSSKDCVGFRCQMPRAAASLASGVSGRAPMWRDDLGRGQAAEAAGRLEDLAGRDAEQEARRIEIAGAGGVHDCLTGAAGIAIELPPLRMTCPSRSAVSAASLVSACAWRAASSNVCVS